MLNNNLLRVLPYEIGKLFHLHILGLHGNPLGKDVMSIYNEPNGTQKLLTYMLDNLTGEWLKITETKSSQIIGILTMGKVPIRPASELIEQI